MKDLNEPAEFIRYWDSMYDYKLEPIYAKYIGNALHEEGIRKLYEWKNGIENIMTGKKGTTVEFIQAQLPSLWDLRENWNEEQFNKQFEKIGLVWRVFLMHIIHPERFPIYDQHVLRAYRYLQEGKVIQEKITDKSIIHYREHYTPFFLNLVQVSHNLGRKQVDNALWAFGKFLKQYPKMIAYNG